MHGFSKAKTFFLILFSFLFLNLSYSQDAEILEAIVLPDVPNIFETKDYDEEIPVELDEFSEEPQIPSKEKFENNIEKSEDSEISESSVQAEELPKPERILLPFEGIDRPEVEKFRQMYLSPKWSKLLCSYLEKSLAYRLYVRKSITDRELPEILEYLPVVESNYKTNAKSSSGAIGLWQFMANSVEPFLVLNDYVDERYDPWKSTDAALRKLTDNFNYFNDWLLAIGAYNCGVGAMNKCIKKGGEKNFWALVDKGVLPGQTASYVPKLLAIADLAINSAYYGLDIPNHNEEYDLLYNEKNAVFDYVSVSKAYSISQLAQEMRIETATLKELNPSYILGFTHPSRTSQIRLPLGMGHAAEEALKSISPIEFPFKYKVEAGDSLWSISRKYGVSIDAICELNGIKENAILRIGKILYIPSK